MATEPHVLDQFSFGTYEGRASRPRSSVVTLVIGTGRIAQPLRRPPHREPR